MSQIDYSKMTYDELQSCKSDLEKMIKSAVLETMKTEYQNRIDQINAILKTKQRPQTFV